MFERAELDRIARGDQAQIEWMAWRAEEVGIDGKHLMHHPVDDPAGLGRRIRLIGEHVIAQ